MKIAICDDNLADIESVRNCLLEHPATKEYEICLYQNSLQMASDIKKGIQFDIAFLDIDMPSITGLELSKIIKKKFKNVFVVFITSYPQYAIDAFDCEAFNYLLKPLDKEKLFVVIDKITKIFNDVHAYRIIKKRNETIRLSIKDISFVESCNKHIIYHIGNKTYETTEILSDVYKDLEPRGFYQIHQGYIVNMAHIDHFESYNVVLKDNKKVAISVRKKAEVLLAYRKYVEENF